METLVQRLTKWGEENYYGAGIALGLVQDKGANWGKVWASLGRTIGYGRTTNEALNSLADALVEEGWPDDRLDTTVCCSPEELLDEAVALLRRLVDWGHGVDAPYMAVQDWAAARSWVDGAAIGRPHAA